MALSSCSRWVIASGLKRAGLDKTDGSAQCAPAGHYATQASFAMTSAHRSPSSHEPQRRAASRRRSSAVCSAPMCRGLDHPPTRRGRSSLPRPFARPIEHHRSSRRRARQVKALSSPAAEDDDGAAPRRAALDWSNPSDRGPRRVGVPGAVRVRSDGVTLSPAAREPALSKLPLSGSGSATRTDDDELGTRRRRQPYVPSLAELCAAPGENTRRTGHGSIAQRVPVAGPDVQGPSPRLHRPLRDRESAVTVMAAAAAVDVVVDERSVPHSP